MSNNAQTLLLYTRSSVHERAQVDDRITGTEMMGRTPKHGMKERNRYLRRDRLLGYQIAQCIRTNSNQRAASGVLITGTYLPPQR